VDDSNRIIEFVFMEWSSITNSYFHLNHSGIRVLIRSDHPACCSWFSRQVQMNSSPGYIVWRWHVWIRFLSVAVCRFALSLMHHSSVINSVGGLWFTSRTWWGWYDMVWFRRFAACHSPNIEVSTNFNHKTGRTLCLKIANPKIWWFIYSSFSDTPIWYIYIWYKYDVESCQLSYTITKFPHKMIINGFTL